jgi:hypothetical protein
MRDGFGDAVWETTHLGGDRYSANMVCLPHGLYYGDLGIADGLTAAARYLRGEVWLERFRGRAGVAREAQAAEHFLRSHTGIGTVDAITIMSVRDACVVPAGDTGLVGHVGSVSEVVAELGGELYLIRVATVPACECRPGCTAADAYGYELRELTSLPV